MSDPERKDRRADTDWALAPLRLRRSYYEAFPAQGRNIKEKRSHISKGGRTIGDRNAARGGTTLQGMTEGGVVK